MSELARDLMLRYHAALEDATPRAFDVARDAMGRSSYDLCWAAAAPWHTGCVLDLGCGGGHLLARFDRARARAGVDVSAAQLARARRRLGPAVSLLEAPGHRLAVPSASVDCVVSHMALMLMEPLDGVIDMVARVLRPGGGLVAVVSGPPPTDATTRAVGDAWRAQLRTLPTQGRPLRFTDPRWRQPDTLAAVLGDRFESVAVETIPLRRVGRARDHWAWLSGMYDLWGHADADVARVRAAMMPVLDGLAGPGGTLSVGLGVRRLTATRRSGAGR